MISQKYAEAVRRGRLPLAVALVLALAGTAVVAPGLLNNVSGSKPEGPPSLGY